MTASDVTACGHTISKSNHCLRLPGCAQIVVHGRQLSDGGRLRIIQILGLTLKDIGMVKGIFPHVSQNPRILGLGLSGIQVILPVPMILGQHIHKGAIMEEIGESVNAFVRRAVAETMERERQMKDEK